MEDNYTAPKDMDDDELYDEYQDAKANGPVPRLDELQVEIAKRWEDKQERDDTVVDGRFTSEGISVSVYGDMNRVLDETWFTWDEVEERKGDEESDFTFKL